MCDKGRKHIQDLEQIVKSALKDDVDGETKNAKLAHIQEKLAKLKEEMENAGEQHKKELKQKDKQINKLKKGKHQVEQKLAESVYKNREAKRNSRNRQSSYGSFEIEQESAAGGNHKLQRQIKKKRDAQEKAKEYKKQNQELRQKLEERQRQNQILREQLANHKVLLEQFARQQISDTTSQDRSSYNGSQIQDQAGSQDENHHMMDITEGKGKKIQEQQIEQPIKPSQDLQTDDQYEQEMEQYASSKSDQGSFSRKSSNFQVEENSHIEQPQIFTMKSTSIVSHSQDQIHDEESIEKAKRTQSLSMDMEQTEALPKSAEKTKSQQHQNTPNTQGRTSWWKWWKK